MSSTNYLTWVSFHARERLPTGRINTLFVELAVRFSGFGVSSILQQRSVGPTFGEHIRLPLHIEGLTDESQDGKEAYLTLIFHVRETVDGT